MLRNINTVVKYKESQSNIGKDNQITILHGMMCTSALRRLQDPS